ncbi:rRNA methyltransferase [Chitinophaga caeni]|uniref:Ribosomal RNA small subunit methyltransferase E n=1 Tax=Chitinophaga caeni TaxID=2029983 RepID=A0A291QPY3_9BACT|nr:RsmE family RNA methyltransferase [Chitinophaga caeni]ATL45975.1 rRNA methyltransferase [Chitinophaga caeni]
MEVPTFYAKGLEANPTEYTMDEATSKYCIQVLRKSNGDTVKLTDGKGNLYDATIVDDHRKRCSVKINSVEHTEPPARQFTVAISFTKNMSRIEWFLEKAVEIGIQRVIPLVTQRTEKEKFKQERLENILVSAMLQSKQSYLLELWDPIEFKDLLMYEQDWAKFIAHCIPSSKTYFLDAMDAAKDTIILIGPEGDFTAEEITAALERGFTAVSLGDTRLRTETAGVVAATLMAAKQYM